MISESLNYIDLADLVTISTFLALAQFGDYLEVFECGGVALDTAVGGLAEQVIISPVHRPTSLPVSYYLHHA